jgi:uncharacterized protein (DUF3084 family)
MSFDDIVEARKLYDLTQAEIKRKKAEKDKKKAEKEKKQVKKEREKEEKKRKKAEKDNDKARTEGDKVLKKTGVDRPKLTNRRRQGRSVTLLLLRRLKSASANSIPLACLHIAQSCRLRDQGDCVVPASDVKRGFRTS